MHLFSGPVDVEAQATQPQAQKPVSSAERIGLSDLEQRVSQLEADVAELRKLLNENRG